MAGRWTIDETMILKRHYPRGGATKTAEILARHDYQRSPGAVQSKACELGVRFGDSPTLVPLADVHAQPRSDFQQASKFAVNSAKRDGVLVTIGTGQRRTHMVPPDWADAYSALLFEREQAERIGRDWLSTNDAARLLGVSWSYLANTKNGHGCGRTLAKALEGVRVVRAGYGRGKLLWHPGDIRAAAAKYRANRKPVGWNLDRAA